MGVTKLSFRQIMCIVMFVLTSLSACGCGGGEIQAPTYDDSVEPAKEEQFFGVVCNIDEVNSKIKLRSVGYTSEIMLTFTGGADVQNKHGELISMKDVKLGSIVDVTYDAGRDKLISLYLSSNETVQVKEGVSGTIIDYQDNTVKIDGKTYQMSKNASAFAENKEIGLDEICSEDQLSVWIYNNIVCSMFVELGHGYVKLTDYAPYLGGMVEIGYDMIVPVTEDMLLTVREGTYTLRISKGSDEGSKEVTVEKNKEMTVSLADIAPEPKEMGSILFHVTPSDAAVYIDRVRVNTEGAVDVSYGKHRLDIVKDGYDTISGTITVDFAYKIKEFTLKETGATTESTISQSSTSSSNKNRTTEKTTQTTTQATTESKTTESSDTKDVSTTTGSKTSNKVTVSAPDGASVYFDGEYIGIAPMSFTKVTGSHIITLSKTGYLSKSYTVTFADDGEDKTLSYDDLESISSLID